MVSRRDGNRNLWSDLRRGARLTAHGIQGCRYLPTETCSSGLEISVRSFRTPCRRPHVYDCACVHDGIEQKWLFHCAVTCTIRKTRGCTMRSRHTKSEDVVWKIGSSNRIISFDSCRKVPRGCRYHPFLPPILIRIFLFTIKEYQVFEMELGESRTRRRNSITIHFANKTQQYETRTCTLVSSKLHLPDHLAPLTVSTCARVPADRALQRDAPERECNYFPSDARRKLDGRSLSTLNVPQRLSEVPLTCMRRIHGCKCARRREAQERVHRVYIIRGNARRYRPT